MEKRKIPWECWVDTGGKVLSFHEIDGYQWLSFLSNTEFWTFINAMAEAGYRIQ